MIRQQISNVLIEGIIYCELLNSKNLISHGIHLIKEYNDNSILIIRRIAFKTQQP